MSSNGRTRIGTKGSDLEPASEADLDFLVPKKTSEQRLIVAAALVPPIVAPKYRYRLPTLHGRSIDRAVSGLGGVSNLSASEGAWLRDAIRACFNNYQGAVKKLQDGLSPRSLGMHANVLKRVCDAEGELQQAQGAEAQLRVPKQRLKRSSESLARSLQSLDKHTQSELVRVAGVLLPESSKSANARLAAAQFLIASLETQSVAEQREDPRRKLRRDLAVVFWQIDSQAGRPDTAWRACVYTCLTDAGLSCIDPYEHPGKFDKTIGLRWIRTFLHPIHAEIDSTAN